MPIARAVDVEPAVDADRLVVLRRLDSPSACRDRSSSCGGRSTARAPSKCSASPTRSASSTAFSFSTGSEPGSPRHTGQTLVFGSAPNSLRQPQNSFVAVASSQCTSSPIDGLPRHAVVVAVVARCVLARASLDRSGDAEHHRFAERGREHLHADRQAAAHRVPNGTDIAGWPGEVRRDRAHVAAGTSRAGRRSSRRARTRPSATSARAARRSARTRASKSRMISVRTRCACAVVRVVVAGRQRVRAEHDAPLHLGAEPGVARRRVHRARRRRASTRRP